MEVVVFGAGSLGSLVGGVLARTHDVTLIGRDPHMSVVQQAGLRVNGVETFVSHPAAVTDGAGLSADLAIVTVKAYDTAEAAESLATGSYENVLSLQNGMGNEELLADHLEVPVLGGATSHGAHQDEPGQVEWTGQGEIVLGGWRPQGTVPIQALRELFDGTGLQPRITDDIHQELWLKLAVNTAINPVTALARVRNGRLQSGDAGEFARNAARETARTAQAVGIQLGEARAADRVQAVTDATARNRSSMLADMDTGDRTEIDHLNGYVVDRAATHGLSVPINRFLTTLVRTWETGLGLR